MGLQSSSDKAKQKKKSARYTVECRCGNTMRVKTKHFGRMCRCTQCDFPIYVTYDSVSPPVDPNDELIPKCYDENEVPINWKVGELITELYQVKGILGQGGMGTVYLVDHRGWDKKLAVKCPSGRLMNDPIWVRQFEHECETWINLSPHSNVVECYYMRRLGGLPRSFVEYVEGTDLRYLIAEKTLYEGDHPKTLERILDMAIQLCWGLHHAHLEGLVHQDVKPGNILIREDGVVKITDFGLAMVFVDNDAGSGSQLSAASKISGGSGLDTPRLRGTTGGTPAYRSNDHKVYDTLTHHADIWSWGMTLIEVFSGDVYWTDGRKAMSVLDNLLKHGSRYDEVPKMPAELQAILRECFQEDRDARPADMQIIAERLKTIYAQALGTPYPRVEPDISSTHVDILNNRAVSLLDLGRLEESAVLWKEVIEEAPEHIEALYNHGLLYWRSGRITDTQMLEWMQRLCEAHSQEWLPRYLTAGVCMERGDSTTAMEILDPITKLDQYHRSVSYRLSMAYHFSTHDKRATWHYTEDDIAVTAVGVSRTGSRVLIGGSNGSIRSLDSKTQCVVGHYTGHEESIYSLTYARSEAILVSTSADKTLRIWHTEQEKCLHVLTGHQAPVRKAVVNKEGTCVVSACDHGQVIAWDIASGKQRWAHTTHTASAIALCLSQCDHYLFSAGVDGRVIQWNLETGKEIQQFYDQGVPYLALCVNPDTTRLYVASGQTIQTWNIETNELLGAIPAHQHNVRSLALSQDGFHALSATRHGTLKVWNLQTGQCLRSLQGYAPIALSEQGEHAISAGLHGDFTFWNLFLEAQAFKAPPMICHGVDPV